MGKTKEDMQNFLASGNKITDLFKKETISTFVKAEKQIEIYNKAINNTNLPQKKLHYSRYKEIVQQIVDISTTLVQGYDDEGNAIINRNSTLEDAIRLQNELNKSKTIEYLS